jgi:hypothetical protein
MTIRLKGHDAIVVAEAFGLPLCKHADEGAREDPRLIYIDVDYAALAQQVAAAPTEDIAVARAEALIDALAYAPADVLVDALASTPLDAVGEALDAWIAGDDLTR